MWLYRLEALVGKQNRKKLENTTVLIIGLGGVGGYALEAIVRAGIKNIIVVDHDIIDVTNLNRQLLTNVHNIGKSKLDEAKKRALSIHPDIHMIKIKEYITPDNIDILFEYSIDYIIDACDSLETKKQLIRESIKRNIKLISCMGTAKKMDPTKLELQDIRKTETDPIARKIRKMVKDEKIKQKVMVVCSKEQPVKRKELASNSFVPATAGLLCASYVINDIVGDVNEID